MAVLNKKVCGIPAGAVYIGRGSKWGNPFVLGRDGTREQVIQAYRRYLADAVFQRRITMRELAELHGKDLVCFCAPLPCHGDVLERAAAWAVEQPAAKALD